jgi:hypothetical protein
MRSRLRSYYRCSLYPPACLPRKCGGGRLGHSGTAIYLKLYLKSILAEDQQAREKVSPLFSFRPLVFPDHAQVQPEFRRREHRLVERRHPDLFVFHLGPQGLRQSSAAFRLAQPRVLCHGPRMEPRS